MVQQMSTFFNITPSCEMKQKETRPAQRWDPTYMKIVPLLYNYKYKYKYKYQKGLFGTPNIFHFAKKQNPNYKKTTHRASLI